jgi:hypothetical protein
MSEKTLQAVLLGGGSIVAAIALYSIGEFTDLRIFKFLAAGCIFGGLFSAIRSVG